MWDKLRWKLDKLQSRKEGRPIRVIATPFNKQRSIRIERSCVMWRGTWYYMKALCDKVYKGERLIGF